jgi:hypothetical protein
MDAYQCSRGKARGVILLLTGLLAASPALADDGPICADRPGKGTSACTVPAGRWQMEIGLYDGSFQHRAGVTTDLDTAAGLLVKYGVNDRLDLEAGWAVFEDVRGSGTPGASSVGDLFLHAKWNAGSAGPLSVYLDPYVKLPTASNGLGNGAVEGGLVVPLAMDLGQGWSLGLTPEVDLLAGAAGGGHHLNAAGALGLGYGLDNGLALGAELWTAHNFDPAGTSSQYSFDLSAAWTLGQNTQLDCGANFGLNRATSDLELYAGVSFRL